MNRVRAALVLSIAAVAALVARPSAASGQVTLAGVAVLDASWHVGASAGQYATDRPCDVTSPDQCANADPTTLQKWDVGNHSVKRAPSYGVQSRMDVRALVVDGPDPVDPARRNRVAIVKNDLYIPQDLLWRRTAQILEQDGTSGIGLKNLTMAVSHDHSSPMYTSTSWGVWAYQDVFDIRMFDYLSHKMAAAVEQAASHLVPVRMGASVSQYDKTQRHSYGPAGTDDGTPGGYPVSDADHDLMVARFDQILHDGSTRPLAILMNFGQHPENLSGNNLISADYIAPLERMVDRDTKATLIFTQGDVGTGEDERSSYHNVHERLEFAHKEYGQSEYGARLMANAVEKTWADVASNSPETPGRFVPFQDGFSVKMFDRFFPGPTSHPYPGVSSCRTDSAMHGDPRVPVVGLPDCVPMSDYFPTPFDPGIDTDTFEAAGIPVPENYSVLAYTGLEEDVGVHLQAIKLGDLLVTICSCEQWKDQGFNIKTRTDRIPGNEYLGFQWWKGYSYPGDQTYAACTQDAGGTWTCPDPSNANTNLAPISNHDFERMKAQVTNDASGWNDLAYAPWAESEPTDVKAIKGNFTYGELPSQGPGEGYGLTMAVSMANDYNGYLASYREYQDHDHYRKALTGYGPHSEDYMATRLVQAGGWLNGGPAPAAEPLDPKEIADTNLNNVRAEALGAIGSTYIAALEAALPADGAAPAPVEQPKSTQRFGAAFFSWNGGSNYTDNPLVKVQRKVDGAWTDFADQSGEVPVTMKFPTLPDDAPAFLTGNLTYQWTATFEAFDSRVAGIPDTPTGTYRFVVDGLHRDTSCDANHAIVKPCAYHLESSEFGVTHWTGITVPSISEDANGDVVFAVGPTHTRSITRTSPPHDAISTEFGPIDYPDSYASPVAFIRNELSYVRDPSAANDPAKVEWYCLACAFRPWLDAGSVATATVTVVRAGGGVEQITATLGGDGRWHAAAALQPGDTAYVAAGGVVDQRGEYNGASSATVTA